MQKQSNFEKWQTKYGALIISLSCFCSAIISWGTSWILTFILVLGGMVCGIIGILDIRRVIKGKDYTL